MGTIYERTSTAGDRTLAIRGEVDVTETYRWWLEWQWDGDPDGPAAVFVGCNPVHRGDRYDATTRAVLRGGQAHVGRLLLVNLYAYRAADPSDLSTTHEPVGECNDEVIGEAVARAALVVACWGDIGATVDPQRTAQVLGLLPQPHAFGVTRAGAPWHPLSASRKRVRQVVPLERSTEDQT